MLQLCPAYLPAHGHIPGASPLATHLKHGGRLLKITGPASPLPRPTWVLTSLVLLVACVWGVEQLPCPGDSNAQLGVSNTDVQVVT